MTISCKTQQAGPERQFAPLRKLAFVKRSMLQALYQKDERDARAGLTQVIIVILLCLWQLSKSSVGMHEWTCQGLSEGKAPSRTNTSALARVAYG